MAANGDRGGSDSTAENANKITFGHKTYFKDNGFDVRILPWLEQTAEGWWGRHVRLVGLQHVSVTSSTVRNWSVKPH